jgi:predicted LPLAT superfamily acyltransferase
MDGGTVCMAPARMSAGDAAIDAAVFGIAGLTGLPPALVFGLGLTGLGFAVFFGLSALARVVEQRAHRARRDKWLAAQIARYDAEIERIERIGRGGV